MSTEKTGKVGFLASVLGAAGLVFAWIFAVGWTYAYSYFRHFGININSLEFPVFQYPIYTFTMIASFWPARIILGVLCIAVVLLIWRASSIQRGQSAAIATALYLLLFVVGFYFAMWRGRQSALDHVNHDSELPRVESLQLKKDIQIRHHDVTRALRSAKLRLLTQQQDRIIVFVPTAVSSADFDVKVLEFNRADIAYMLVVTRVPGK